MMILDPLAQFILTIPTIPQLDENSIQIGDFIDPEDVQAISLGIQKKYILTERDISG